MVSWLIEHWSSVLGDFGIVAGLFFSGFGFWRDFRIRRAQTLMDITKLHRELWTRYQDSPELSALFDKDRDLHTYPLADKEVSFANFLFLHIRGAYHAELASIYVRPDKLKEDIVFIFSHPAPRAAWVKLKRFHDRDFIAFIEGVLGDN